MIETTILKNLINDDDYLRQVIPFLQPVYFQSSHKTIFSQIASFVAKYNTLPSKEAFIIELENSNENIPDAGEFTSILESVFTAPVEKTDNKWLLDATEKWCQDRAIHIGILESIGIIDGKSETLTKNAIPDILSKALSVSFDRNVGHDYIDSSDDRWAYYHRVEERIPFDLDYFNQITHGGLPRKTLNICMAGTGVGKSLFMCHVAGSILMQNKNVLYITLEMAEERIAERIDANLMDYPITSIGEITKSSFINKVKKISKKTRGKLIIKEYPTASAHVGHFRALLNELKLKKNFEPDMIFIDYINICASSRIKGLGGSINTYSYVKSIAEELRGLAVEFDVPILSATQTTRSGFTNSDVGLEDTSESFGLPATADMMFALITTEELDNLNQLMVKQLKNRYADLNNNKRFVIGIDRSKMRLYDVEANAQTLIQTENGVKNVVKTVDATGFQF
jgi:archaellum biogenesis ATPase FlaH